MLIIVCVLCELNRKQNSLLVESILSEIAVVVGDIWWKQHKRQHHNLLLVLHVYKELVNSSNQKLYTLNLGWSRLHISFAN